MNDNHASPLGRTRRRLIATGRALPPLAGSPHTTVAAIASRSEAKAKAAAQALGVPRAYGSYEELLANG
jgi:predicted dehydrogenase